MRKRDALDMFENALTPEELGMRIRDFTSTEPDKTRVGEMLLDWIAYKLTDEPDEYEDEDD